MPRPDPVGDEVRVYSINILLLYYYYYTGLVVIHVGIRIAIVWNVFILIKITICNIIILVACIYVQVYAVTYQDLFQAKWPAVKAAPARRQGASSRD